MPSAYYFVLPYAEDEGTQMLLVQRQLIQRRIAGKQAVYGQIPNWAGQWVLVGGKGEEKEPATTAALRLFREQTGINLSEQQGETYGVEKQVLQELRDKDYNPFTVLFLELSGEGLNKLKSDVKTNINDRTVFDGVLQNADIVAGPLAPDKIGPIEPPPNGWRAFLVTNYYEGKQPGQLDTTIDILQMQITQRSKASAEWFRIAIGVVPEKPIEVVPTAITLAVTNATQTNGNEYVANYDANNTNQITITATTTPNSPEAWSQIVWTNGAQGDAANKRLVPVDQITDVNASIDVTATIPGPHSASARCKVVPRITALTVVAYGFQEQGQDWYTLVAANPPAVVGVTTVPATPAAWAQVVWTNTTGAGRAGNEQLVARNDAGNIQITATIPNGDHPQLNLFVKPPLPLTDLTLQVHDITFDGAGSGVRSDANIDLGRQWVRNVANPPQTYPRNTQVSLRASIDVTHAPYANIVIDVRATGFFPNANGGSTNVVWQQNAIAVNAVQQPPPIAFALAGGLPNLPNEVNYQDTGGGNFPLNIIWEMRVTNTGNTWVGFDATTHPFYVTLGAPVGNPRPYWTELNISCLAANGETVTANAITAIYQPFTAVTPLTGANNQMVRTSDGVTLKYWYQWWLANAQPQYAPGQRNSTMLANQYGNGSCLAWSMMLVDMLRLHGINTGGVDSVLPDTGINAAAADAGAFLVKTWNFVQPPAGPLSSGNGWSHTVGTNCAWLNGPGQNQQYPPPVFRNHYIVAETTAPAFYDPSYGSAAQATHQAWEGNATDGLMKRAGLGAPNAGFIKGAANAPATVLLLNGINFPNY